MLGFSLPCFWEKWEWCEEPLWIYQLEGAVSFELSIWDMAWPDPGLRPDKKGEAAASGIPVLKRDAITFFKSSCTNGEK